ncbi:MAG: DEAD/DEAH box helicase [Flavobacteriales bacterium]|jgi:ATP-dependent RNA helicase DeaD|uniref:DEAD/DEAH box helicase n=1 Tax=Blattabacterium sp. (Mastotermes darwiniensis) TaxID=39768 RepID=UPI000231DEA3|nr:DEAD/DEAH box helicase [Blattabacterium sp. (Mastotermes darwiniensis)]AER40727.1 ATP-dependent RNA helicase [Blattabacterium sp. (Mastotermes darwiniensis) str. MADAR]MDR1804745.1 DEAD/DEAH box helicase [Flavobacteriales bacterium]
METFKEYNFLSPKIIQALEDIGFLSPTTIQKKVIPFLLKSEKDIIALAQTGTGKTASFGLPIIQKINLELDYPQALILCPTRELCIQITRDLCCYSKYISLMKIIPLYGGVKIDNQIKSLHNKKTHIIVGTPGRILDLIRRNELHLSNIKYLVIDEADEMLNMGFKEELDSIMIKLPKRRQNLLFSATMSKYMNVIAHSYLMDPIEIITGKKNIGSDDVKHIYYISNPNKKYLALKRIVDINPDIYGIIFCRTRKGTKEIAESLIQDGYNADALYGDLSQAQREFVMNRFRKKKLQFLVATDIAARGIDINDITHVINYNLPDESEIYVHRSGRTGRAGNTGISVSIIHYREIRILREFEKKIGKKFEKIMIPSGKEICQKQLLHFIEKVKNVVVDEPSITKFFPDIQKKLESFDREELIKRFSWIEFNRFISYYNNYEDDINNEIYSSKIDSSMIHVKKKKYFVKSKKLKKESFSKLFLNIGYKDHLTKLRLINLINEAVSTKKSRIDIGNIEILSNFSLFEVKKCYQKKILMGISKINHFGKPIFIKIKN